MSKPLTPVPPPSTLTPHTLTPPPTPLVEPAIPLTPALREAYEELSDQYQAAFDANADFTFRTEVLAWKTDVDNILEKDAMYRFNANTALFEALLGQINGTNADLVKIKAQIAAVAGKIALAADILEAIDKVLTTLMA